MSRSGRGYGSGGEVKGGQDKSKDWSIRNANTPTIQIRVYPVVTPSSSLFGERGWLGDGEKGAGKAGGRLQGGRGEDWGHSRGYSDDNKRKE